MHIKKIISVILFLVLTACSEVPQEKTQQEGVTGQEVKTTEREDVDSLPEEKMRVKKEKAEPFLPLYRGARSSGLMNSSPGRPIPVASPVPEWNTESYNAVTENGFISTANDPLSTFSIDVDTASYSNVRRFINEGKLPPKGAVRIEELINYFSYTYPRPNDEHPFSVTTELGPCPWNDSRKLVRIGLKARDIDKKDLPPSNLVFLIDVSGSMSASNKLPLLQKSMKMLVKQLGEKDRISVVAYAGSDHVVLPPTAGSEQRKIIAAIDTLGAGGSTHASSGIVTAYQLAEQVRIPNGNNRIILASDGDFNVGITSRCELQK
ncbi:MAG: VWA domain-containing protein, partial [Candidatus Electrothrix sp. ATG2]|nr:VWA domain-containing protein [Candidatus Electrothrix sp. ATG2]